MIQATNPLIVSNKGNLAIALWDLGNAIAFLDVEERSLLKIGRMEMRSLLRIRGEGAIAFWGM
jgi:hypothetical protein